MNEIKHGNSGGGGLDIVSEMYAAYTRAINRFRWFTLITTILSALLLLHIFLEKISYQDKQLAGYMARQEARHNLIKKKEDEVRKFRIEKKEKALEKAEEELGLLKFRTNLAENTIKDRSLKDKLLPLLGLPIPANDFLPVMSIMNLIFMVGVLLNQWSIEATVTQITEHVRSDEAKRSLGILMPLHFVFNGLDKTSGKVLQFAVLILPAFSVILAGSFDIGPAIKTALAKSEAEYVGSPSMVAARFVALMCIAGIALLVNAVSVMKAKELDARIRRWEGKSEDRTRRRRTPSRGSEEKTRGVAAKPVQSSPLKRGKPSEAGVE